MGRQRDFRYRTQKQVTHPVGITFLPEALERLDFRCQLTRQSRGAIISHLLLQALPPASPPGGGAA